MALPNDNVSMALFCDFENVALGVRDANYDKFDIKPVLERLLLKGSIVVKKAYCDWDRYKAFKAPMHEANFELIEIPHVRQSGKNSADIRMVVDALDLCYTKAHVDTFVIISGDSDFSPLVSKLRENAKKVIGVGVKQSTSDLLVANCDEFIFYDDLVRESRRAAAKRDPREAPPAVKRTPEEEKRRREDMDKRRNQAMEIVEGTFDALVSERGDSGKIWASVLKEAIKRRKPDFSESYYGFRTFGNLLEEAKARGLLEFGRDEKSGAYVYRSSAATGAVESGAMGDGVGGQDQAEARQDNRQEGRQEGRRGRGRGRSQAERYAERQAERAAAERPFEPVAEQEQEPDAGVAVAPDDIDAISAMAEVTEVDEAAAVAETAEARQEGRRGRGNRGGRKQPERKHEAQGQAAAAPVEAEPEPAYQPEADGGRELSDWELQELADAEADAEAEAIVAAAAEAAFAGQPAPRAKTPRGGARAAKAASKPAKPAAKPAAKPKAKSTRAAPVKRAAVAEPEVAAEPAPQAVAVEAPAEAAKPARKAAPRSRRPRKTEA